MGQQKIPKVGVFDSGIGGLTVLAACAKRVPAAYYYFGDNANAPYGTRSPAEIYALTRRAFELFAAIGVDAAIVACNTATAVCIDRLRREYPFPVVGTEPAIAPAARECASCLLLATEATLRSERVHRLLFRYPETAFRLLAPKGLVRAIEENALCIDRVDLSFLDGCVAEGIILGCTHFVFLKPRLRAWKTYDGGAGISARLREILEKGRDGKPPTKTGNCAAAEADDAKNLPLLPLCAENIRFLGEQKFLNRNIYKRLFA